LNSVGIDLTMPLNAPQTVQIEVPQVVSWRLHERFRWPADQILLLSCGVVAAPVAQPNNTLIGANPPTLFGLNRILPPASGQRTDALLMIEYKGPASTQLLPNASLVNGPLGGTPSTPSANNASLPQSQLSRGRY
jgi:hypothetical protein